MVVVVADGRVREVRTRLLDDGCGGEVQRRGCGPRAPCMPVGRRKRASGDRRLGELLVRALRIQRRTENGQEQGRDQGEESEALAWGAKVETVPKHPSNQGKSRFNAIFKKIKLAN